MILTLIIFLSFIGESSSNTLPDTLTILTAQSMPLGEPAAPWIHVLPKHHRNYTNFEIVRGVGGQFLRGISSATASYLELDVGDIDISTYPSMIWEWSVEQFPETEWESNRLHDDFAVRIELIYDYKGGKNPITIIKKGLITSLFKHHPPEVIVSYVWSLNIPVGKPYKSPRNNRMTIIPIESGDNLRGRWIQEKRNITADLKSLKLRQKLYLKKIRIYSDTDDTSSKAECGIRYIYLTK